MTPLDEIKSLIGFFLIALTLFIFFHFFAYIYLCQQIKNIKEDMAFIKTEIFLQRNQDFTSFYLKYKTE